MKVSIRNLKEFKTCFQEYKSVLPSYFTGDKTPKTWEFQVGFNIDGKITTNKYFNSNSN